MKLLITGADSFVGSYLIPELLQCGHEVILIGKDEKLLSNNYKTDNILSYLNLDQKVLEDRIVCFQPECVVHLAAYSTPSDGVGELHKLIDANIVFLGRILEALKQVNVKMFINTGSFAEYFDDKNQLNPAYLYTATKTAARSFVKYYASAYNYNYCHVCPYSLYGGVDTRKKIMDFLFESLDAKNALDTTSGEQVLDFIHIDDLIRLYMLIIEHPEKVKNGSTFHAGTGVGHTLKDIVKYMEEYTRKKANVNWGGRAYRNRDVMYAVADISLQKEIFGWEALVQLKAGIKRYIEANSPR
jgi:nucleoside-diphosphate-sugar epimerase